VAHNYILHRRNTESINCSKLGMPTIVIIRS